MPKRESSRSGRGGRGGGRSRRPGAASVRGRSQTGLAGLLATHYGRVLGDGVRAKPDRRLAAALWSRGILGIGYGIKMTSGILTPVVGARIYVAAKRPRRDLAPGAQIPDQLEIAAGGGRIDTDVVAVGTMRPLDRGSGAPILAPAVRPASPAGNAVDLGPRPLDAGSDWLVKDLALLRSPLRPVFGGCSVGPELPDYAMAGTLGAMVKDGAGKVYALSNNHVLAASRLVGDAPVVPDGASIYQPGTLDRSDAYVLDEIADGGAEKQPIGKLARVVPIKPTDPTTGDPPQPNLVDAALAEITDPSARPSGSPVFSLGFSLKSPPAGYDPQKLLFRVVGKVGRTTGALLGVVVDVSANFWIPYGDEDDFSRYAWFESQLAINPVGPSPEFSGPGDSGSGVFDAVTGQLVALLFAGGGGVTLANPIDEVFRALNVTGVA